MNSSLFLDGDTHAAGGSGDHAHSSLERACVEVGHLGLSDLLDLLLGELCDLVLVMSVEPGKSGQKFLESAIKKIEQLNLIRKQKNLNFKIEVDGGINAEIAKKIASKGEDIIVSGSYIFNAENKKEAINSLK